MRFFLIIILAFFISNAFAGEKPNFTAEKGNFINVEEVSFLKVRDPGWLVLDNEAGEEYTGDFYYDLIKFDDIETWAPGEKFIVRITADKGAGLVREKTNKFYKVFFRQERHPVDVQLRKCKKFINEC